MKMKKLMVILGAVAMAASVQAATWSWGASSNAYLVNGDGALVKSLGDAGVSSIVLMYLGNGATADWSLASDANVRSTANFTFSSSPLPGVIPDSNKVVGSYVLDSTADANGNWYGVMFKDSEGKYNRFTAADGETPLATDSVQLAGFADASSTVNNFTFASANYTAVPEPTSGLLMLVGLAGLALRRRRA
jgi:hypothetical protein